MKTYMPKKGTVDKKWVIFDARGKILGRLATKIATILMGKNKPIYSPHVDCGDSVVVINAKEIKVSGKKEDQKLYHHYTGYPSGMKEYNYKRLMERKPEEIIRRAVKRMLPHNNLGRNLMKKLRIFAGSEHTHAAQKPVEVE